LKENLGKKRTGAGRRKTKKKGKNAETVKRMERKVTSLRAKAGKTVDNIKKGI